MAFQAVIFTLGSEEYGFRIDGVQEITRLTGIHPLPNAPAYIKGLINIRGQAIPLINLHTRLGLKHAQEAEYAIISKLDGGVVAFAVEDVREVKTIEKLSPPPLFGNTAVIEGIVNLTDRMIIQLNPQSILEKEEIEHISELLD